MTTLMAQSSTIGNPIANIGIFSLFVVVTMIVVIRASKRNATADEFFTADLKWLAGALFIPAFALALGLALGVLNIEFAIAFFVSGFNETLPVRILAMFQGQVSPRINAVGRGATALRDVAARRGGRGSRSRRLVELNRHPGERGLLSRARRRGGDG